MGYQLGVDLGTTYTAAAVHRDGRVEIATLGNRAASVPSVVFLKDDESILTGDAAARRGLTEPDRLSREFKRRVGDPTPILLGGAPYSAERLMARLLRWVVDAVSEREGGPPDHVAVSHPANWGPYKTDLLRQAIDLAGLRGATTLTEPVAAAMFYASTERVDEGDVVAVYDLGGGTFDAAVLAKTAGGFETLGEPEGIERLGGIDFDEAVFAHVRRALERKIEELDPDDPAAVAAVARLRQECVEAKEALSSDTDATIPVMLPNVQTEVRLTRSEFEAMIRPPLTETIEALRRAIEAAGIEPADLKTVLLVGGSSRIPIVAQMVGAELRRPVAVDAHPKHTIALGAALAAARAEGGAAAIAGATVDDVEPADEESSAGRVAAGAVAGGVGGAAVVGAAASAPPTGELPNLPEPEAAPSPPGGTGDGDGAGGRPAWLVPVIGVVVVLLLAGVAFATLRSGGDGSDDSAGVTAAVPDTAVPDTTLDTTETTPVSCAVATGRCASITGITLDGDTYLVDYETVGYSPEINDSDPSTHHMHFFFSPSTGPDTAGIGPNQGTWQIWDTPFPFDGFTTADVPAGDAQMCVVVGTFDHAVDDPDSGNCVDLPT